MGSFNILYMETGSQISIVKAGALLITKCNFALGPFRVSGTVAYWGNYYSADPTS